MKDKSLIEYVWRNSYQIVGWGKDESTQNFPIIFGGGFVLRYNDEYVFITADHVIHLDDYEEGERMGDKCKFALVCNCNEGLTTMLLPISGFYSEDEYNFNKYINGEEELEVTLIPNLRDVAISILRSKKVMEKLYTCELQREDEILVRKGLQKLYLTLESITEPSSEKCYVVAGVVQNSSKGIKWEKLNAIYDNLKYAGKEMGLYKFRCEDKINITEWEGLSGSPLFDESKKVVGMILRAVPDDNLVWVLPMSNILEVIRHSVQIEKLEQVKQILKPTAQCQIMLHGC